MDGFYHGIESSLLALGFALSVATFFLLAAPPVPTFSVTLPMLTVDAPPFSPVPAGR